MTEAAAIDGGCACGTVRYRLHAEPMFIHCCHCRDCQRETGSAFVINALVETTCLEMLSSAAEPVLTPSASGQGQQIWRCPACRIALWSHYHQAGPAIAFIRAGTLDDPGTVRPDVHIYVRSKLPWVTLPGDVPAVDAIYDPAELWPADVMARFAAARS